MIDMLSENICNKHNFFNNNVIKKTIDDHLSGENNNEHKLWNLIQFNNWYINNF